MPVDHILTVNARGYCGRPMTHPHPMFLELSVIEHPLTLVAQPRTKSFEERFKRTVLDESFRQKFYALVDELQADQDPWPHRYNSEGPHRGDRNTGKRPIEIIKV